MNIQKFRLKNTEFFNKITCFTCSMSKHTFWIRYVYVSKHIHFMPVKMHVIFVYTQKQTMPRQMPVYLYLCMI